MPTLGLALIVKDEEKDLPVLLESVKGVFDEIVVVDTGSTDRTKEIAKSFGAKVYEFAWIDDFAAARNHSFSKITSEWTCWLDADDVLKPESRTNLLALKARLGSADCYLFPYDYAQDEFGNSTCILYRHRILRTSGKVRWQHPIHECLAIPSGFTQERTEILVTHRRTHEAAVKDKGRNLRIMRKAIQAEPGNQRLRFYFARELEQAGEKAEAIKQFEIYLSKPEDFRDNKILALSTLAQTYLSQRQDDKAIETCFRGMAFDPRWGEFYLTMGHTYYERAMADVQAGRPAGRNWQTAAHWYEIAARTPIPDTLLFVYKDHYTWVPQDRLCKCYGELGRFKEAYDVNEIVLKYRPNDRRILANRAYLQDRLYDRLNDRPYRLNLGGGQKPVPSYRNCDLFPGGRVEFLIDQCKLPYVDGTVHAIYSEHALEHAPSHYAAREAITEWARASRHGAHLTLKVPDMEACCREYVKAEDRALKPGERWTPREWYRFTLHGIQRGQGTEPDEGQYHRTGFSKEELRRLLEGNGWKVEYLEPYDGWGTPSLEARAIQLGARPKIRWLVRGKSEDEPSTRIRRLNISRWLSKNGVDSSVSDSYAAGSTDVGALLAELRQADVVVFTQFSSVDIELAERLNRAGIATVFDMNEDLEGFPGLEEMLDTVRTVTFCSTALKEKYGLDRTGLVLVDAFETTETPLQHDYAPHGKDGKVRVLWSGMGGNAQNAEFLRPLCAELGMEFLVMSEWPSADIKWDRATWLKNLNDADVVVSPQRIQLQSCKSNTKATQAMALGVPVVVSPLKAYTEAVKSGENGFVCATPEEWKDALVKLKDQEVRKKLGEAGKAAVRPYSVGVVGIKWRVTIEQLCREICNPPKVDIIIPTFNNLSYLQPCIESIRKNTDWPYNLIVVNSGTDGTEAWLAGQSDVIAVNSKERLHFSAANNAGLKVAKEPYVCLLNDDTIVSEGWLPALMHEAMKPGIGAVGPFSNCDKTWLHNETITAGGVDLHPGMTMEEVGEVIPQLYKLRHRKEVHPRGWLAFYCTLVPRAVIDQVGLLDEEFKSGDEDLDYCRRIAKAGFVCRQTYDSVVFHFGGRTRKFAEGLNPELHMEEDRGNHEHYRKKWGDFAAPPAPPPRRGPAPLPPAPPAPEPIMVGSSGKKLFVLYTGAAWERWSPLSVDEGGIGGSETCAVYVAREFARKGWESIVFGDCADREGDYDGVRYFDHSRFGAFAASTQIDLFVSSRRADIFALPIKAQKKVVWVHDIWLNQDPNADLHIDRLDKIFVLSPWHKKFFMGHHKGVPEHKIHVTRDGIDLSRFEGKTRKIPGRMVYSSSPDRGLETLLDLLPRIQKEVPEAEVHIFYGFENWEKSARARNDQNQIRLIDKLRTKFGAPGVIYRGRVGQKTLAKEFMKAELWAYPTWFTETFCITGCEAMAAGAAVVTTPVAALETTVGNAGVLVDLPRDQYGQGITGDPAFQDRFAHECIRMLVDQKRRREYSKRSLEKAKIYGWESIVDEWLSALDMVEIPQGTR